MPKVSKPFTDHMIKSLKPGRDQSAVRELTDGGCRGLLLRLTTRGEKLWAIRIMVNGRRTFHPLGAYPVVTLAEARKRAGNYLAAAKDGVFPGELDARHKAEVMTIATAHAEYIAAKRATLKGSTIKLKETMFRDHMAGVLGNRLMRTVRRSDVVDVVGKVAAKGFPVQANRVFSEMMALLRWCEQRGYVDGVPSTRKKDIRAATGGAKEQVRRRTLTDEELTAVWQVAGDLGGLTGDFLRLLILTGQRRDEVRLMAWAELDMSAERWSIPAGRYKTGITHSVPLSPQAMAILRSRWSAKSTGYVLAGRGEGKPFNGAASAIRRLRKKLGAKADFTLHDIRRTVRTGLSRLGVDEATAEMVIGHMPQGIVKVYDQHDRMDERREALARWADHLDRLTGGNSAGVRNLIDNPGFG
jgi:integrase